MRRQYKKTAAAAAVPRSKLAYTNAEQIPGYQRFTLDEVVVPDKVAARSDDSKVIKVIEASDVKTAARGKKQLDAAKVEKETTEGKDGKETTDEKKGKEE